MPALPGRLAFDDCFRVDNTRFKRRHHQSNQLEIGKPADVVVLSQDIFEIDPNEIQTTKVIHTIVGGEVVYSECSEYRL